MKPLTAQLVRQALAEVGNRLRPRSEPIELVLAGGVAGLLEGSLRASRTTGDCDVISLSDQGSWAAWEEIEAAAEVVGASMSLPKKWLNSDCRNYAWCLPLNWRDRCLLVGRFGPLTVVRIARFDLMATKLMGSPTRPQDFSDLQDLHPSDEECAQLEAHLDRLQNEDLDDRTFDDQRSILDTLRSIR